MVSGPLSEHRWRWGRSHLGNPDLVADLAHQGVDFALKEGEQVGDRFLEGADPLVEGSVRTPPKLGSPRLGITHQLLGLGQSVGVVLGKAAEQQLGGPAESIDQDPLALDQGRRHEAGKFGTDFLSEPIVLTPKEGEETTLGILQRLEPLVERHLQRLPGCRLQGPGMLDRPLGLVAD
jgi:hypothetical protein